MPDAFYLKRGDTLKVLQVTLERQDPTDPDSYLAADVSAADAVSLNIILSDGTVLTREMTVSDGPNGVVTYAWAEADFAAGSGGSGTKASPYTAGGLVASPALPLADGVDEHRMEYEVLGPSTARETFPNNELGDVLRITDDIADGSA